MYDGFIQVTKSFAERTRSFSQQTWLYRAMKRPNNQVTELLAKLERIISIMPICEQNKLNRKFLGIIPAQSLSYDREYDEKFLSVLVEILGWGKLKDLYPTHNPKITETPDLVVADDSGKIVAAMECKTIRESDEEKDYFNRQEIEAREVKTCIISLNSSGNPLLRKLNSTFCKAEKQLSEVKAPCNFIFLHIEWDVSALIQENDVKALIANYANELYNRGIFLIAFENLKPDTPFVSKYPHHT